MADPKVVPFRRLKWGNPKRLSVLPSAPAQRRARGILGRIDALLVAVAALAGFLYVGLVLPSGSFSRFLGLEETASPTVVGHVQFALCTGGPRPDDCIVDGDTFHYGGLTIRIADIDTPEVRDFRCAGELALGQRATERLLALMNAGPFELRPADRDEDRYGRKLRTVWRDGVSLGAVLVDEGLARHWDGARRGWCA